MIRKINSRGRYGNDYVLADTTITMTRQQLRTFQHSQTTRDASSCRYSSNSSSSVILEATVRSHSCDVIGYSSQFVTDYLNTINEFIIKLFIIN